MNVAQKNKVQRSLAGLIGVVAGLALAASAPAVEIGAGVSVNASVNIHSDVDIRTHVDVHPPVEVRERVEVRAPVPVGRVAVVRQVGELSCTGSVRYQVRSSAWATHERGGIGLDLPVRIRTNAHPCRLNIEGMGYFEAEPGSEYYLTRGAERLFYLTIERGAVRYSVSPEVLLRVRSSVRGLNACVGGMRTSTVRQCEGRAVVDALDSFQVYNLGGRMTFERHGSSLREVAAGHGLRVRLSASTVQTSRRTALVREYTTSGEEIIVSGHDHETYDYDDAYDDGYYRYKDDDDDRSDTHRNQQGQGHTEHGNGKGLGHTKENGSEKARGLKKERAQDSGKAREKEWKQDQDKGKGKSNKSEKGNKGQKRGKGK